MKKQVLFYTPFLKVGGIEKASIEYLKLLKAKGVNVELLVDYDMGSQNLLLSEVPSGVRYHFIKDQRLSRFIYFLRTQAKTNRLFLPFLFATVIVSDFFLYHFKVKKIIQRSEFDLIVTFYQFLPAYLTRGSSAKNVIWLHGSVEHFFSGLKNLFIDSYLKKLDRYDKIVTISDEMEAQLLELYPALDESKITRIYNPLDFDLIKQKSVDNTSLSVIEKQIIAKPYICHVSRLDEGQKDISTLIKAFAKLKIDPINSHNLVIVGTGPDIQKLKLLSYVLGLVENIFFVGNQLNPYIWMKQADVLVLSSKFEGFGLVLVEAMSVGTFVIASSCKTGPREILADGQFGDLFDVGNVDALSQLLFRALSNPSYRQTKTGLAYERIRAFDREQTAQDFLDLIK